MTTTNTAPVTQAELEALWQTYQAVWRAANAIALRLEAGAPLEPGAISASPMDPASWRADKLAGFNDSGLQVFFEAPRVVQLAEKAGQSRPMRRRCAR